MASADHGDAAASDAKTSRTYAAARDGGGFFSHVVSTPWLFVYLLEQFRARGSAGQDERVARTRELLELLVRNATLEPVPLTCGFGSATLTGGKVVVHEWAHYCQRPPCADTGGCLAACLERLAGSCSTGGSSSGHAGGGGHFDEAGPLLSALCAGLDAWALRQVEPSTSTLLATQLVAWKRPRHGHPALNARLRKRRRTRAAVAGWVADSGHGVCSAGHHMMQTCARYERTVFQELCSVNTLELCLDASRFGGRNIEVCVVYSPDCTAKTGHGLAAYLPPQQVRELLWRTRPAGTDLTEEDKLAFDATGFRTKPHTRTYDFLRLLNHCLSILGRDLGFFQAASMPELTPGAARKRCPASGRWLRICEGASVYLSVAFSAMDSRSSGFQSHFL